MIIFVIKKIRENKCISQYKLSHITNISRTYIRNLENNKNCNPTMNVLFSIASALEVNIKDLFYSELDIENLKQEMYKRIENFGISSNEVLETSQLIDLLINIKFK